MKKIVIGLLILISAFLINAINLQTEISNYENIESQKIIKFEGAYEGVTSESFDENSSIIESFDYSEIKFFIEPPSELEDIEFERPLITDSIAVAQEKLNVIRTVTSEIIVNNNISVIDELTEIAPEEDFLIGTYSSVIKLTVDNQNLTEELIGKVDEVFQSLDNINEVYISEPIVTDTNEMASAFPIINVSSMINSGLFTGRNVNVGIAESGAVLNVSKYADDYSNRSITIKSGNNGVHNHADHVTMIAVGNNGIARGSNILASYGSPYNNDHMTWLLDNGANIINTSYGDKTVSTGGTYTSVAKEMDEIIRNSFITMVGSAGNNDIKYPSSNVTSPKTAYNYITVGACQGNTPINSTITSWSCYGEQSGYGVSKPNLVAPGNLITNSYGGKIASGTSFATPQVTGSLALLMEEFPFLIAYPELCLSVLTSSASPMSSTYNTFSGDNYYDQSGLHNQIGSGLLNYEKMREAMNNYVSITRARNSAIEDLDDNGETLEFTASKNQRVRASLAWLANGTDENNFTDYDLYLQRKQSDGSYITLMFINGTENNVEFLDYTFGNDGTYRLLIKQKEVNVKKDLLAMSYVLIDGTTGGSKSGGNIEHTCSNYIETGSNPEYHIDKCDCGYNSYELHSKVLNNGILKCQECEWFEINNSYTLSNYSSTINKNFLVSNETMDFELYELNSMYDKNYEFYISSTESLVVRLYDDELNLIEILDLDENQNIFHFIYRMNGSTKYYLSVGYENNNSVGTINTKIVSRTTAYIGVGDNDVLLNTHNYNEGIYPTNYYYYINSRGVGFYRFTLTGVKADGTTVTYPYSSIMIKDHMNEDIIDKYSLTGYSNQAISGYNENTFVAYLNATGYFYVYIDIDTEGLKSLTLNIEPVESETIDLFTKSESTNSTMEILDSETTKGDYAKKIILKQACEFTVNYSYSGSQSSDILFVLGKLNYNSTTQKYTIETLISQLMDAENDSFTYTLDLTDGTYFVAYFNKDDNAAFDVTFNRLVTQYGGSVLIPDPDMFTVYGSEVRFNNGVCRGTNLTVGFTRFIYLDNTLDIRSQSRLDYYWYSSDENVASISDYGTLLGLSPGIVKIMAVYKNDPSVVYVKQFTVLPDTRTEDLVVEISESITYAESGQIYEISLTDTNSPYPLNSLYEWSVVLDESSYSVTVTEWGTFSMSGTGTIVLEGRSKLNPHLVVRFTLIVT